MGLAYGAADEPGTGGYAKRIAVIIGPAGEVIEFVPSADCAKFPREALSRIP
jgi:hypothetical protein